MKSLKSFLTIILFAAPFNLDGFQKEEQLAQVERLYREPSLAWPGLDWKAAPLMVTFGDGVFYSFGRKGQAMQEQEDLWGIGEMRMQPRLKIDGEELFFFRMGSESSVQVLAHERFHLYQIERFEPGEETSGYGQHLNAENVALMGLEEALLREFVQEGRQESLKEYAAVHRERVKLLDPDSLNWEEMQERFEGMADYVAAKMTGQERSVLAQVDQEQLVENAMKWRHYGVGAALGLGLDALQVQGWKERVEWGASLSSLLEERLALSQKEAKALSEKAKQRLQFDAMRRKIESQVSDYAEKLQKLQQEHEEKAGVCLRVGSLPGVGISGGGRSDAIYYLSDGSQISVRDQSESQSMDGRWRFETKQPCTLIQASEGFREVKAAPDLAVMLDGAPLPEDPFPKEYLFETLEFQSSDVAFASKQARGVLVKDKKTLEVWFAD